MPTRPPCRNLKGRSTFTYCTEYIVKRDPSIQRDPLLLRAYLESIGDCVVVVDDENIIKVHVHTGQSRARHSGRRWNTASSST